MKSFAKKFLSIALAAVLLLGVLPMAAFAAGESFTLRYFTETGDEITDWKQEINEKNANVAPNLKDGVYTLQDWNVPMNYEDPTGAGRKFLGWAYKNHPEDMAAKGQPISSDTMLIAVFEKKADPKPEEKPEEKPEVSPETENTAYSIRYFYENGTELKEWNQEVSKNNKRIAPYLNADGSYELQAWNLPMNIKDESGLNRQFLGWAYKNHPADMAKAGDSISSETNLIMVFAKPAKPVYCTVSVSGTSASVTVEKDSTLSAGQIQSLKDSVKVPTGKKLDSLRAANNEVLDTDTVIKTDLVVDPYFVDDPNYNPRPDGADWYYTIHMDEGWVYGAKYDAPKQIQQNQRFGIAFKNDKNVNGALPVPSRNLHVFRGWYLVDEEGYMTNKKVDAETIFDEGRHVTLRAKWEREAEVYLRIYRNGNTTTPYTIQPLYGYAEGEDIYTKDLKIGDYYKNGGKPFDFDGWYDRGGWTLYKAKDNPKPISSIKASEVGGQTILYCMITDSNAPSNKTPDHTNPKTGDESMIIATTAVMLVSAGALAVFFMDRKRRNG